MDDWINLINILMVQWMDKICGRLDIRMKKVDGWMDGWHSQPLYKPVCISVSLLVSVYIFTHDSLRRRTFSANSAAVSLES